MCLTLAVLEDLDLVSDAADAADELLRDYYSVDIAKALNPLDKGDFKKIVMRLSNSLRRTNASVEAPAMRAALDALDVDWPNLKPKEIDAVIKASTLALAPIPAQVIPRMSDTFEASATATIGGTKRSVKRRFRIEIEAVFNARDQRITDNLVKSQTNFVTDEYGRRVAAYDAEARAIVGNGLDQGLSRHDIGKELNRGLGAKVVGRNQNYWNVVAAAHVSRARSWGQLASFSEAAIEVFVFEAVMDERTTEICRYMHGREFQVSSGVQAYESIDSLADPTDIKTQAPWVWQSKDAQGNSTLVYRDAAGDKQRVAQIDKPGLGRKDSVGSYSKGLSSAQLEAQGISMPPLHGL